MELVSWLVSYVFVSYDSHNERWPFLLRAPQDWSVQSTHTLLSVVQEMSVCVCVYIIWVTFSLQTINSNQVVQKWNEKYKAANGLLRDATHKFFPACSLKNRMRFHGTRLNVL